MHFSLIFNHAGTPGAERVRGEKARLTRARARRKERSVLSEGEIRGYEERDYSGTGYPGSEERGPRRRIVRLLDGKRVERIMEDTGNPWDKVTHITEEAGKKEGKKGDARSGWSPRRRAHHLASSLVIAINHVTDL